MCFYFIFLCDQLVLYLYVTHSDLLLRWFKKDYFWVFSCLIWVIRGWIFSRVIGLPLFRPIGVPLKSPHLGWPRMKSLWGQLIQVYQGWSPPEVGLFRLTKDEVPLRSAYSGQLRMKSPLRLPYSSRPRINFLFKVALFRLVEDEFPPRSPYSGGSRMKYLWSHHVQVDWRWMLSKVALVRSNEMRVA